MTDLLEELETAAQPSLGHFMRLLAHELGNPVATIRMSAEMIQSTVPPEMHTQLSTMILEEAVHLEELIERALFYASIKEPSRVDVNVSQLMGSIAQQFPSAPIAIEPTDESLHVSGDAGQLGRMISESIGNAIDAGAASIALSAQREGDDVVLSVCDDGEAIGEGAAAKAFDPFYTTREGKLGLGLTIARRIAALHGGSSEARPDGASGTIVSYRIPINR